MTLGQYRKHFPLAYQPRTPDSDDEEEKDEDILVQIADHSVAESYFKAQGALAHAQEGGAEAQIKLKTLQASHHHRAVAKEAGDGEPTFEQNPTELQQESMLDRVEHSLRSMGATPRFSVVAEVAGAARDAGNALTPKRAAKLATRAYAPAAGDST